MGFIVQFNDGNDAGVFVTHHEIGTHAVNPVVPCVEIVALFDAKKSHNGHPENERCDQLAREEIVKVQKEGVR